MYKGGENKETMENYYVRILIDNSYKTISFEFVEIEITCRKLKSFKIDFFYFLTKTEIVYEDIHLENRYCLCLILNYFY